MEVEILVRRFHQMYGSTDLTSGRYLDDEYSYKHDRGQKMRTWFARDALAELVATENYAEICHRVVQSFTMPGPLARWDEYQWVRDLDEEERLGFSYALRVFLYGDNPFPDRLDQFVADATKAYRHLCARSSAALDRYRRRSLTWPFVSYFHFMMWPEQLQYAFLKPTPLRHAAEAAGFDLQYHSTPNAETYQIAQAFYEALWPRVHELGGRDWIDVQTLIHVAGGGFGTPKGGWIDERSSAEGGTETGGEDVEPDEKEKARPNTAQPPSLAEIQAHIADSGFVFSPESVANYHISLLTKPFVILTGLSGTGKTLLTRLYADAVHQINKDEDNPYYRLIAVRPDWNDHRGLLGYYNPLTETYDATPFLEFLLRAAFDPEHWYYVCLDEMNLARVEYYFSDYLSAIEAHERLQLHPYTGQCVAARGGDIIPTRVPRTVAAASRCLIDGVHYIPATLPIPPNLLVTGTVNVDETTHAFSDKVLDRANSIELNHADLDVFLQAYLENHPDRAAEADAVMPLMQKAYDILEPCYAHFGYRTLREVFDYLWQNATLPEEIRLPTTTAMDNQLMQKVLPKLRGDERIRDALVQLRDCIEAELGMTSRSVRKLTWMLEELDTYGSTHFWR